MNERIKELAERAGLKHHNWITNESNITDGDFKYPRLEDYEKFAELLIRECMSVIGEKNYGMLTGKANCTKIKRHFGVSE